MHSVALREDRLLMGKSLEVREQETINQQKCAGQTKLHVGVVSAIQVIVQ